jgi:hypothetical protein
MRLHTVGGEQKMTIDGAEGTPLGPPPKRMEGRMRRRCGVEIA